MHVIDIRQSDLWSEYLKLYNWVSIKISNNSILRINSYLFTKRASLQLPNNLNTEDLAEIENVCRGNGVLFLKISPSSTQDVSILESQNYKKTKSIELAPNTILIDLTIGFAKLFKTFSSNCRYSIRKSEKEGYYSEVIAHPTADDLEKCYKVLISRSKEKHFLIPSLEDLLKKVEIFGSNSFIFNVFNKRGELLGTKFFLGNNKTVWGLYSGTTELGKKSTAGYKLLSDSLKYFSENNYEYADIGGVDDDRLSKLTKNWKNYSRFKREFNGEIVYFSLPYVKWFW